MFCTAVPTSRPRTSTSSISSSPKRVPLGSRRRTAQHAGRAGPDQQRRDDAGSAARAATSCVLFGVKAPLRHVAPVDAVPGIRDHLLHERALARQRRSRAGSHCSTPKTAGGDHPSSPRRPPRGRSPRGRTGRGRAARGEGAKRLVELERRAERARAAVRGLEQVDAATELVPQTLGLPRPRLGAGGLGVERVAQAPDDDAGERPRPANADEGCTPAGLRARVRRSRSLRRSSRAPARAPPTRPKRSAASAIGIR